MNFHRLRPLIHRTVQTKYAKDTKNPKKCQEIQNGKRTKPILSNRFRITQSCKTLFKTRRETFDFSRRTTILPLAKTVRSKVNLCGILGPPEASEGIRNKK